MLTAGLIFTGIQIGMSKKRLGKISNNEKVKKRKLITKKFKINFVNENKKGIPSVRNKSLELMKKKKNIWCVGLIDDDCFIHRCPLLFLDQILSF